MDVYAYGPYKADLIRQVAARDGVDLSQSYAYSDSCTDLPMLESVGHPVVVNPDKILLKVARERDWEVLEFVRPVRLRDRMPVSPGRATAAASVSAALAAGAVVLWRLRHPTPPPPPPPPPPPWWTKGLEFSRLAVSGRRKP
jgi:hypothetical protein